MSKHIRFKNPPSHINKYLTHWTGRNKTDDKAFDTLCQIIRLKELRFSKCDNGFEYESGKAICNTMICFTDTPIEQSLEHCQRYNYFGISFNKEKLIECGANPVLYMVENRKSNQEFLFDFRMGEYGTFNHFFYRNNELSNKFSWFSAISQPYKTKKVVEKGFAEYLEREWRITRVLPSDFAKKSVETGGNYNENFEQEIERKMEVIDTSKNPCHKNENNLIEREVFYLPFKNSFIENVIVLDKKIYIDKCKKLMKDVGLDCKLLTVSKTKLRKTSEKNTIISFLRNVYTNLIKPF